MSVMTCLACNVGFEDAGLGRIHYKTEWHRYNLKRKVANLAPVTLEKFEERQSIQEKKESSTQPEGCNCKPCNKSFSCANAYENHLQSKKHKETVSGSSSQQKVKKTGNLSTRTATKKEQSSSSTKTVTENVVEEGDENMEEDDESDAESWDSYDGNSLGIEECLFCSFISSSIEDNIKHMTIHHGFFLPDAEYISDLEALITYLGEKVGAGHVCLWCNEKGKKFHNSCDVQKHMVDKGHCKLLHEGEVLYEYADFYNYTKSYPDCGNPEVDPDEAIDIMELDTDGFSLVLPSGATIGHRSLVRYYKQNMVPHCREGTEKTLPKMLAHYKALGWTGSTGPQVEQRAKDLQVVQRIRKKHFMRLGCKANNLRHHYRDQNL